MAEFKPTPRQGDILKDFRGDKWEFVRVIREGERGRSTKIEVKPPKGPLQGHRTFYAHVFPELEDWDGRYE